MPSYSFKFHEIRLGQARILRPVLPVLLTGPARKLETGMLVDSGADVSMIQLEFAQQLGIPLDTIQQTGGISEEIPVYRSVVRAEIRYKTRYLPPLELPVQVPTEPGRPPLPLLGREVFFYEYDISFRMGYTPTKGKFVLKPVERRRSASRYR